MRDLRKILSSIPEDRISMDSSNGQTIITLKESDGPSTYDHRHFLNNSNISIDGFTACKSIFSFNEEGNRQVDLDALIEKFGEAKSGPKYCIKAKDLSSRVSASSAFKLCKVDNNSDGSISININIQNNIQDSATAGKAGLEFICNLELSLAKRNS